MTAYFSDPWLTIHEGDCRAVLREMEPESVHCVVTSPPYWSLRDYGHADQLGLEPTPEKYVASMVDVFREVRRVLRVDGTVWLNIGDSYYRDPGRGDQEKGGHAGLHTGRTTARAMQSRVPGLREKNLVGIPWRVAFALQADGWYLRSDIIWSKPNPMPESVTDRPTKSHEYLFLLSKSARYFWDADAVREAQGPASVARYAYGFNKTGKGLNLPGGASHSKGNGADGGTIDLNPAGRNLRSVWQIATAPYPGAHFATFPPKLVEPCIKAGCPDKVCGECGAPWERVTAVVGYDRQRWAPGEDQYHTQAKGKHGATSAFTTGDVAQRATLGFRPTCLHDAPTVPGVVLDPFAGTGTVGLVAQRLSRRAVLIDLNAEYLRQCLVRNAQTPLGLESA